MNVIFYKPDNDVFNQILKQNKNKYKMSEKLTFNFKSTEPDQSTFTARTMHMMTVTNPKLFFVPDSEILSGVETVRKFQKMASESKDGNI